MKNHVHIIAIFILFLCSCQKSSDTKSPLSTNQETTTDESPAFNKELIIDIEGDSIAAYAFIAKGKLNKETIILIQGYPGNDTNFDIAQEIRRSGKNVIHFNHRGAWGSQGLYSYSNCLEDVEQLINFLSEEEIAKALKIDTNNFTLLGRSYGGGIALIKGSQLSAVKRIIAISTTNYGEIMDRYTSIDELGSFKKYMRKQIMINHNVDEFLQELLDKKEEFSITNYKELLKEKELLHIEDSPKNEHWIKQLEKSELVIIESDHNFVDKRIELSKLIVDWLK